MRAFSLYSSPTLLPPQNHLCSNINYVSVCSSTVVIKSQLSPTTRPSFSTLDKLPRLSGVATESRDAQLGGVPTSVPVRVARELLQAGYHYLDVRIPDEFSVGHVVGAVNVPYMLRLGPGMVRNPNFLEQVLTIFSKDDEIIVGCELGKRSFIAASQLVSAGFTGITDMAGGYAAWVQNGLPSTE